MKRITVMPVKSDSDVIFVYKVIRDLDRSQALCINPIHSGVYKIIFYFAIINKKMSLSLLVGTTVDVRDSDVYMLC